MPCAGARASYGKGTSFGARSAPDLARGLSAAHEQPSFVIPGGEVPGRLSSMSLSGNSYLAM